MLVDRNGVEVAVGYPVTISGYVTNVYDSGKGSGAVVVQTVDPDSHKMVPIFVGSRVVEVTGNRPAPKPGPGPVPVP